MLTFHEARQIAEAKINAWSSDNDALIIVDEKIIEKEYAWIFPYTSKKWRETNDFQYAIAGNGPIFVSKFDGKVSTYRTGLGIAEMIDEHEEVNKFWRLSLIETTLDATAWLALKKTLKWTQGQVAEFQKNRSNLIDQGSKRRLEGIQIALDSNKIKTTLTFNRN